MRYRQCRTAGLQLPVMGLGCWSFGGGEYWGSQTQNDVEGAVHTALDAGCTYFDTAEVYNDGNSETALGIALKSRRDEAIIGTKISPSNCHPVTLRNNCHESLNRLGVEYVDLYMIHWPIHSHSIKHFTSDKDLITNPPRLDMAVETLLDLQQEGKIKHIGVSNFGVNQLKEILALGVKIAVNELPYSLLFRSVEKEVLPLCEANGVGVIGYMNLMQGILSGKYPDPDSVPSSRARTRHFNCSRPGSRHKGNGFEKETFETLEKVRVLAVELGLPMHLLAIAWSLANPSITCTLVGARNKGQLIENLKSLSTTIDKEKMSALDEATRLLADKLGPSCDLFEHPEESRIY